MRKFHLEQFNPYYHGLFLIINFMGVVIYLQSCKKNTATEKYYSKSGTISYASFMKWTSQGLGP